MSNEQMHRVALARETELIHQYSLGKQITVSIEQMKVQIWHVRIHLRFEYIINNATQFISTYFILFNTLFLFMRSSRVWGWDLADVEWDLAEWLERLIANVVVATVLGSIPASSDTVKSEGGK